MNLKKAGGGGERGMREREEEEGGERGMRERMTHIQGEMGSGRRKNGTALTPVIFSVVGVSHLMHSTYFVKRESNVQLHSGRS